MSNLQNSSSFITRTEVTLAEYIWIDGSGLHCRSKTKTYNKPIHSLKDLDWWTYDGSSTEQAPTQNSEIYLKPVFVAADPFRKGNNVLVLCETYLDDLKTPARNNFRYLAKQIMDEASSAEPWFGIEQEYFIMSKVGSHLEWPIQWPVGDFPAPQGKYYCSSNNFGREIAETHLNYCLQAGLKIAGINSEVSPSQWEFQVGITHGIEIGDHLWTARYILERVAEIYKVQINFHPKPIKEGEWNGSGCHTNYSTKQSREQGGFDYIVNNYIPKLRERHQEHIQVYGKDNDQRLVGKFETANINEFSFGVAHRGASIRIPVQTEKEGKGYFEDRRPASNIDPYLVSSKIVDTTVLNGKHSTELSKVLQQYQNQTLH